MVAAGFDGVPYFCCEFVRHVRIVSGGAEWTAGTTCLRTAADTTALLAQVQLLQFQACSFSNSAVMAEYAYSQKNREDHANPGICIAYVQLSIRST